jgi:thymidine kinase
MSRVSGNEKCDACGKKANGFFNGNSYCRSCLTKETNKVTKSSDCGKAITPNTRCKIIEKDTYFPSCKSCYDKNLRERGIKDDYDYLH